MEIINRKAKFDYEFIDTYVAGIMLKGNEISSIREGKISISESYCYFVGNELYLKNCSISSVSNEDKPIHKTAQNEKKLLLNKSELSKIRDAIKIKGLTVIPYKVFINDRGLCKVSIAIAKGKKNYDKRETIKKRDIEREIRRNTE